MFLVYPLNDNKVKSGPVFEFLSDAKNFIAKNGGEQKWGYYGIPDFYYTERERDQLKNFCENGGY